MMDGDVTVASEPGKGSVFTVRLCYIALVLKYFDQLAPIMQEQDSKLRPADFADRRR